MRSKFSVEARRTMPKTSYPSSSRSSARYDPSWPVIPVISALRLSVMPFRPSRRRPREHSQGHPRGSGGAGSRASSRWRRRASRRRPTRPRDRSAADGRGRRSTRHGTPREIHECVDDLGQGHLLPRGDVVRPGGHGPVEQEAVGAADVAHVREVPLGRQVADVKLAPAAQARARRSGASRIRSRTARHGPALRAGRRAPRRRRARPNGQPAGPRARRPPSRPRTERAGGQEPSRWSAARRRARRPHRSRRARGEPPAQRRATHRSR